VWWDTKLAETTADSNGNIQVSFIVPADAAEGEHAIDVRDEEPDKGGIDVRLTFTVTISTSDTEPPTVSWVKPEGIIRFEDLGQSYEAYPATKGTVALEVAVSDNAGIRSVLFERFDEVNQQWVELGTDTSEPYQASVAVDTLSMQWNQIRAVAEDTAGNLTHVTLLIFRLNPTITLGRTEGPRSTQVRVEGEGWIAGDVVSIQFAKAGNEVTQATVGDDGSFVTTFTVPADAAFGEQQVIATTTNGLWENANRVSFTVVAPKPTPTLTPAPTPTPTPAPTPTPEGNEPPTAGFTISVADRALRTDEGGALRLTVGEGFNSKIRVFLSTQRSSDPEGDRLTYEWRLNNTLITLATDSMNRGYIGLAQGTQNISLTVKDDHGGQASAVGTVIITPRSGATQLPLSWPFIGTQGWNKTAGNEETECKPGTAVDHCGDDWFAEDWNWGGADRDRGKVLLSPTAGRVIFTTDGVPPRGYGRQVILQNLDSVPYDSALRFTHLEESWVTNGEIVCPGTPIGTIGFSGLEHLRSNPNVASHLHVAAYMGVFQDSDRGSTGYHWLTTNSSYVEALNVKRPSRFALDFNFDRPRGEGCGGSFAVEGRVVDSNSGDGIGGVDVVLAGPINPSIGMLTFGDGSGHFAFNALPKGQYTLTFSKESCRFTDKANNAVDKLTIPFSVTDTHQSIPDVLATTGCK
jgi:hypothetical protein